LQVPNRIGETGREEELNASRQGRMSESGAACLNGNAKTLAAGVHLIKNGYGTEAWISFQTAR
jgi:hypothetical protein